MNTITGFTSVKGGRLYHKTTGPGEPVVFIHGFTLDHRMWQPQVAFFSPHYQVITYDARGFGRSSLPTDPYNHHDDLALLLQHLGIKAAHVIGLSMGGRITVNFALEHPEMVRSLALLDAALDGYADTVDWNVHAKTQGLEQARRNWLGHELFAATRQNPAAMARINPIIADYSGWHWLHHDPQAPSNTHAKQRLPEIQTPTSVVVGEHDLTYFHNIADSLASGILHSHKEVIPNVGHMVNLEAPDLVNQLLLNHLEQRQ